jgi:hypothetical protein
MFVKAVTVMQVSSSVLMAETAVLALATSLLNRMGFAFPAANFFTDDQLLANYINSPDHSNLPDKRIKPYTQIVTTTSSDSYKVHQIRRSQNQMADSLAKQGLASFNSNQITISGLCSNPSHVHGCPLLNAI